MNTLKKLLSLIIVLPVTLITLYASKPTSPQDTSKNSLDICFKQFYESTQDYTLNAIIPNFSGSSNSEFIRYINTLVEENISSYLNDAKERIEKDKEAFLATGGIAEELRTAKINIDYKVTYNDNGLISFVILQNDTASNSYEQRDFYNLNFQSGVILSLETFLGPNYVNVANEEISKQISVLEEASGQELFFDFEGISWDQDFYINSYGNPVIVFKRYEIAPGYMGFPEFEIVLENPYYPPTVSYNIQNISLTPDVNYPSISGYDDEVIQSQINESLRSIYTMYTDLIYSDLVLDYEIKRIDDEALSILFRGSTQHNELGYTPFVHAINLDMVVSGTEINTSSFIKDDPKSQEAFEQLLKDKANLIDLEYCESQSLELYFQDSRVVFFYTPTDCSYSQTPYLHIALSELDHLVDDSFYHLVEAS